MRWQKKGKIFQPDNQFNWMASHAQIPVVQETKEERLRIYFGTRNNQNQTNTAFIEVDKKNPKKILYKHDRPLLQLGALGSFDASGVMPSWITTYKKKQFLYYIGWNTGSDVPYRVSIGLAVSEDGGITFEKCYLGPIVDRNIVDPFLCSTPCVLIENGIWRMWYLSGVAWKKHFGKSEPYYHIRYAESQDGIIWKREGQVCIDFKNEDEGGLARPCVIKENGVYRMWYCYRGGSDYRTNKKQTYRIGYAESENGIDWIRMDAYSGFDVSSSGWDCEMVAYPFVINMGSGEKYLFYNGNGFGKSGFGYATGVE